MAEVDLTQAEIDERVAILKRFRQLLQQQRNKFREYLTVLERQQTDIEQQNPDSIMAHAELEQQVLANIVNLRRVISPMEKLYETAHKPDSKDSAEAVQIPHLQAELDLLQEKVLLQNEKNRELLKTHMTDIRTQINQIKNPYRNRQSVYSSNVENPAIIDLQV